VHTLADKTVIIITGPTASGKTSMAIHLAQLFGTEIISADSRQCYREMKIGVARPSEEELKTVPHHFIASHSIQEEVTAAGFEKFALSKTAEIFKTKDIVIMVGGTGLYIRAFCEGLDAIPEIDPVIRKHVIEGYEEKGLPWLQEQIREQDPLFYEKGEIQNPQRMMRALEVFLSTGQGIFSFRTAGKATRDFRIIKTGLDLPKETLHQHIHQRVDQMIAAGQVEEARSLFPFRHGNALQTVGYSEFFDYFEGKTSLEKAIELVKTHTRQYAKRQLTWFRRDQEIEWFNPARLKEITDYIKSKST
jgi:tRNA dimethylallyltransferase